MTHVWLPYKAEAPYWARRCPYCGTLRHGGSSDSKIYRLADGSEVGRAPDCTRPPLDCSRRADRPMKKLAPFLRGDHKGDAARAALPGRPPGRRTGPA